MAVDSYAKAEIIGHLELSSGAFWLTLTTGIKPPANNTRNLS